MSECFLKFFFKAFLNLLFLDISRWLRRFSSAPRLFAGCFLYSMNY